MGATDVEQVYPCPEEHSPCARNGLHRKTLWVGRPLNRWGIIGQIGY